MFERKRDSYGIRLLGVAMAVLASATVALAASHVTTAPQPFPPAANPGAQALPLAVYVVQNGQQTGPFDRAALSAMARNGGLTANSIVWQQGMANWAPAANLPELQPLFGVAVPAPPPLKPKTATDPQAFLVGTWVGDPQTIVVDGIGPGTLTGSTTYGANRELTIFSILETPTNYGLIRQTISGQGTFTAVMKDEKTIVITPNIRLTAYIDGQPPVPTTLTTPFIAKIIDQNTAEDEKGNRSYRQ